MIWPFPYSIADSIIRVLYWRLLNVAKWMRLPTRVIGFPELRYELGRCSVTLVYLHGLPFLIFFSFFLNCSRQKWRQNILPIHVQAGSFNPSDSSISDTTQNGEKLLERRYFQIDFFYPRMADWWHSARGKFQLQERFSIFKCLKNK